MPIIKDGEFIMFNLVPAIGADGNAGGDQFINHGRFMPGHSSVCDNSHPCTPRRWAAIMASAIFGLVMEYTAMSTLSARPSSAIMRSSHSVPGVKNASMCAGALGGEVTVRVGNCAPTPTPMANAIAITKVHCLTNIQPQTKDHSNKSGRELISLHRNSVAFDKSYNNGIPTIVGTLKASLCKGDQARSRL